MNNTVNHSLQTDIADSTNHYDSQTILFDLPHALARNEFFVVYQPIVDITTGRVVSYEALIRWNHPKYGIIYPGDFIPIAERHGYITEIDIWVLKTVLSLEFGNIPVHVNVSAYDLASPNFLETIKELVGDCKDHIVLEFTETAQIDFTKDLVKNIKELQMSLAVDDFGTGYSSLVLLNTLKVNLLKIDIHFVKNILIDLDSALITDSIIRLGNSLNMDVIAEGVESYEQMRHLYRNGCRLIQGYYISKPLAYENLKYFSADSHKLSPKEKYIDNATDLVQRFANNALILIELDEELNYIRLTENFSTYLGYPTHYLKGRNFRELIPPDQLAYFNFLINRLNTSGYIDNVVLNLVRKDYSLKSTIFSARFENKTSKSIIVYLEDYAFYNEKIEEINGVRNAYSILFHEGPLATIVWSKNYEIVDWNAEATATFGWDTEEVIGKNLIKLLFSSDEVSTLKIFEALFFNDFVERTFTNRHKNKTDMICRWINRTVKDANGDICFIISMATNITQNLITNDYIKMLSTALEKSKSAVVITDVHGTVEYSNTQFRILTEYTDGLIGKKINQLSSHEQPKHYYKALWDTILSENIWQGEFHNLKKNGTYYWCTATIVPTRSNISNDLKFIAIQEDMTELHEKEESLTLIRNTLDEQNRLSMIGAMLAGIIHEITSPLTIVNGNIDSISAHLPSLLPMNSNSMEILDALKDTQQGLDHLINLLKSYKEIAFGKQPRKKNTFDLQQEIRTILAISRHEYKYDILIDFSDESDSTLYLYGMADRMRQVLMNLFMNAVYSVKYSPSSPHSKITILSKKVIGAIRVEIHDNGDGISDDIKAEIFKPFYTTKLPTHGTGLGLSICKSIIEEEFLGHIDFYSNEGDTCFYFEIPVGMPND